MSSESSAKTPNAGSYVTNTNGCDISFNRLIHRIKITPIDTLIAEAVECAAVWRASLNVSDREFESFRSGFCIFLKQNADDLIWLYRNMSNYRSKFQLNVILHNWLTCEPDVRIYGLEKTFEHYFDLDIIKCDENEVFVDCGVYNGDSILSFIEQYGERYKSIYGYEMTPKSFETAQENLKGYERVYLRNVGVSDENGTMTFMDNTNSENHPDAGNRLTQGGNATAKIVKLDDDIKEDVTFIKMDIEGAEIAAILGTQNHIKRTKPKLAISLYHKLTDLIEIPKLIKQLVPEYKFYFQHCPTQFPFPTEYVLLAVIDDSNEE